MKIGIDAPKSKKDVAAVIAHFSTACDTNCEIVSRTSPRVVPTSTPATVIAVAALSACLAVVDTRSAKFLADAAYALLALPVYCDVSARAEVE